MLEGVLQQLVNCFLEASGGSLTFSHRLFISTQKSAWVELKTNLKHRECVFFHFGVCWNSTSTASWMHLQEISWIVQKRKFFSPLFFHTFHQLTNEVNWHQCWKVCCSSSSTASWMHLQEISWIVQKQKFFSPLFFYTFHQLTNEVNWHQCWKVCCSGLSTASWWHLEEVLHLAIDLLFHPKKVLGWS